MPFTLTERYRNQGPEIYVRFKLLITLIFLSLLGIAALAVYSVYAEQVVIFAPFLSIAAAALLAAAFLAIRGFYNSAVLIVVCSGIFVPVYTRITLGYTGPGVINYDVLKIIAALLFSQLLTIRRRDQVITAILALAAILFNTIYLDYTNPSFSPWQNETMVAFMVLLMAIALTLASRILFENLHNELAKRETAYQTIFEQSPFPMGLVDRSGTFTEVNQPFIDLFSSVRHLVIGRNAVDLGLISHEQLLESVATAKTGEAAPQYVVRINRPISSPIHALISVRPISLNDRYQMIIMINDITSRVMAEEALKASEEEHRSILESIHDLFYRVNQKGIITMISPSGLQWLKASRMDQIVGHNADEFWANPKARGSMLEALKESGILNDWEFDLQAYDGSIINVSTSIHAITDRSGNPAGYEGILRNITERKKTENALRESENMYRTIFENTGTASIIINPDTTIALTNSRFVSLSGYSQDELENHFSWTLLIHPDDVDMMVNYHHSRRRSDSVAPKMYEFRLMNRQGEIHYIMGNVTMIPGTKQSIASLVDISEQKNAEEKLRQSEQKFSRIFDSSIHIIVISQVEDGIILDVNPTFEETLGYSREEAIGKTAKELNIYHGSTTHETYQSLLEKGPARLFEQSFRTRSGEERVGLMSVESLTLGGKECILSAGMDITELKRAERDVHVLDEKLRAITINLPGVVFQFYAHTNGEMGLYYVSERVQHYFGLQANSPTFFQEFVAHVDPTDRPSFMESIDRAVRAVSPWSYEGRYVRDDGKQVWFRGMSVPVKSNGEVVFDGILLDITDQKLVEYEKEKALAALQKSEAQYRLLADNAGDVIWVMDLDQNITYVSPSVKRQHGWLPEEWQELKPEDYIAPRSLEVVKRRFAQELELVSAADYDPNHYINLEVEQYRKDGSTFWCEINARFLYDDEGKLIGIQGITRDITERLQMQEVLIQNEKMTTVAGLAAGMAHEINNPLGIIMQSSENAWRRIMADIPPNHLAARVSGIRLEQIRGYVQERKVDRYLTDIHEAGARAARIVSSMLHFSRRSESKIAYLNINDILDKTLELASNDYDLKKKYDFRQIVIRKDYGDIPDIPCTETEIEQVFFNLFKNSAQAMSQKYYADSEPTISIKTWGSNESVSIQVEDNGPGMDESTRKKVFEPFYTTKEPGMGTGLGLSVSYFVIVNSHQGKISVDSSPGQWTRFNIELPTSRLDDIASRSSWPS